MKDMDQWIGGSVLGNNCWGLDAGDIRGRTLQTEVAQLEELPCGWMSEDEWRSLWGEALNKSGSRVDSDATKQ